MSTNVHLHLPVTDLERSVAFYQRFLGAAPVKVRPGYAKFLPPWAPLNLAISVGTGGVAGTGRAGHFGLQVDEPARVREHLERVRTAGLPVREELGVECCHANQDKFWLADPDGNEWEVYHLNHDLPDPADSREDGAEASPVCPTACCAGSNAPSSSSRNS